MLIFKYLTKEILSALLATTFVLMLIFMSTQFIHYLSNAAFGGRYSAGIVFHIMVLQIPYLLGLLLPLGFYLAILTGYGRLHAEREMLVLHSCGFSEGRLLANTLIMALVVAIVVAGLTCWIAPYVAKAQKQLKAQAQSQPLVSTIMPGRFYSFQNGRQVFYIENVSRDRRTMKNLFVATETANAQKQGTNDWSILSAHNGYQYQKNTHVLVVTNGNRYEGIPGTDQFQIQHFDKLTWKMSSAAINEIDTPDVLPFSVLFRQGMSTPQNAAELQWRVSMPLSVFLLTFLALPLCKVNPRQGKFALFLPAVLIYIFYANMMFVGRAWMQNGVLPVDLGIWWLHGLVLILALAITFFRSKWSTVFFKTLFTRPSKVATGKAL